jgi:hypothetical protein
MKVARQFIAWTAFKRGPSRRDGVIRSLDVSFDPDDRAYPQDKSYRTLKGRTSRLQVSRQ